VLTIAAGVIAFRERVLQSVQALSR
jgi:hypothetical protein